MHQIQCIIQQMIIISILVLILLYLSISVDNNTRHNVYVSSDCCWYNLIWWETIEATEILLLSSLIH